MTAIRATYVVLLLLAWSGVSCAERTGDLYISTGIVFQSGNVKPVARTQLYLLDSSFVEIMTTANVEKVMDSWVFDESLFGKDLKRELESQSDLSYEALYSFATKYPDQYSGFLISSSAALAPHIIASAITDFEGNLKFEGIPPATYYVFGASPLGEMGIVWNLPVDVESGGQELILDQRNAAFAH